MPKMKTHKGSAKRMMVTAKGKITHKRPGRRHLLSNKRGRRLQKLSRTGAVHEVFVQRYLEAMGAL